MRTQDMLRPWALLLLPSLFLSAASGCQLAYFLTDPEQQQQVKAEWNKFEGRRVAVVVWADRSTLDVFPHARRRVCKALTYHMKKNLPNVQFVESGKIEKFQSGPGNGWEWMTPRELAEKLDCELILRLDLLEYTSRASDTRELHKGRIRATLNLYETHETGRDHAIYETEIDATFPPKSVHGVADLNEEELMHETVELFAEETARKFYDHGRSMRGPTNF